jgi:predicted anti-sigma-YlaC factor YlaD
LIPPAATHHRCDRARSLAALAPDGELSELERMLLRSHLGRCVSCSRFAADVAVIASSLRAASLEPLSRPIAVPTWRRRRVLARLSTVGAAAAVVVMALGIAARSPLANGDRRPVQVPQVTDFSGDQAELQLLRTEQRRATTESFGQRSTKGFGNQPS